MANSETGHAKNIAYFNEAIKIVESWGTDYNPSKAALKVANLKIQVADADASQNDYGDKKQTNATDKNLRSTAFKPVDKLATKISNAMKSTDANDASIEDVEGFCRKIHGERAGIAPQKTKDADGNEQDNSHSVAQLSYTNIVNHLKGLNKALIAESSYTPNENELKIATIATLITNLSTLNDNESKSFIAMNKAKIARDKKLYAPKTGIFDTFQAMKDYAKSLYTISSPQYKQLAKLKITEAR
jgi:hypothetical protein